MNFVLRHPISSGIFLAAIIVLAYILAWLGFGQGVDFQTYRPAYLPPGVKITTAELYVIRRGGPAMHFDKHLNIYMNWPNSWIEESPTTPRDTFDGETLKYSPRHQAYYMANQDLEFNKGGTLIWVTLPNYPITASQLGEFVDSFQPAKINVNKTTRMGYSG